MHAMYEYPFAWPSPTEQPPEWESVHEEPLVPVTLPSGDTALLITRYDDVRAVLADHRVSKDRSRKGTARMTDDSKKVFQAKPVAMHGEQHSRVRRLINKAFTARRIEGMRPRIVEIVEELLDDLAGKPQPVDLNAEFSFPLTIRVICELLGVPDEERENFGDTSNPPWGYMRDLIERRREEPGDDLISALISVHDSDDGRLSTEELVWWCTLLLLAGYETTANQVTGSVVLLLNKPDEFERLRADPELMPAAIEELLRCQVVGSALSMLRVVTEDIEVAGRTVPAGTTVIPGLDAANFDPSAFKCPARFDVERPEKRQQLTFSTGQHFCLGAPLARVELQEAIGRLIRRYPALRLAVPTAELSRAEDVFFPAFTEVPVRF
jgi:pikromycin synthase